MYYRICSASLTTWLNIRDQTVSLANFRSPLKAPRYQGPLLQSHGIDDEIVPFKLGNELFNAFSSDRKTFVAMAGVGHNSRNSREYEAHLTRFLAQVP